MELFVFFALPLATILLSIVLQKILKCPILVAITVFAIFLIVAFAAFSDVLANALIATIVYTILAYITAIIVKILFKLRRRLNDLSDENESNCHHRCNCCNENDNQSDTDEDNNCNRNEVTLSANFIPNNGGRTGRIRGCWRRM